MEEKRHNDNAILAELRGLKDLQNEKFLRIEGILEEQKEQHKAFKEQSEKMNERITIVELWKENSMGKIAIIFTIVGIGVSILIAWISNHFK